MNAGHIAGIIIAGGVGIFILYGLTLCVAWNIANKRVFKYIKSIEFNNGKYKHESISIRTYKLRSNDDEWLLEHRYVCLSDCIVMFTRMGKFIRVIDVPRNSDKHLKDYWSDYETVVGNLMSTHFYRSRSLLTYIDYDSLTVGVITHDGITKYPITQNTTYQLRVTATDSKTYNSERMEESVCEVAYQSSLAKLRNKEHNTLEIFNKDFIYCDEVVTIDQIKFDVYSIEHKNTTIVFCEKEYNGKGHLLETRKK